MQALGLIEVVGYPPAVEAADAALKAANVTLLSIAKADAGIMTVELVGDVGAITSAVDAGARSAAKIGFVRARHVIPRVESDLIGKIIPCERGSYTSENTTEGASMANEYNHNEVIKVSVGQEISSLDQTNQNATNQNKDNLDPVDNTSIGDKPTTKLKVDEVLDAPILVEDDKNYDKKENYQDKINKTDNKVVKDKASQDKISQEKQRQNLLPQGIELTKEQLNKQSNAGLRGLIQKLQISIPRERLSSMKKQELIKVLLEYKNE